MKSYEIAQILTAIFTGVSMFAMSFRAYIAYKDLEWKKKNKK